jgi:hypothetical protein|uniref:Protein kinase domain-containing protein n=1 Tax=viral metagenome TaxID=1070528 RepID=A0A6C0BXL1_9ZZZZ
MFTFSYKKNNNVHLFKTLEENGFNIPQNYIPLYKKFFSVDENNYNNINLNHKLKIFNLKSTDERNTFICSLTDGNSKLKAKSFFKFSPLIDPAKYMVGKYKDSSDEKMFSLPKFSNNICQSRLLEPNNAAYIDSFFSYLSSMLHNYHKIPHCLDFYGSFLCIKENFKINIADDLDFLYDSTYYHKNKNKLFDVDEIDEDLYCSDSTRNYRKKISFLDEKTDLETDKLNEEIFDGVFKKSNLTAENIRIHNNLSEKDLIFQSSNDNNSSKAETNSECSSRSSNTSDESSNYSVDAEDSEKSLETEETDEYEEISQSIDSDIDLNATFKKFPVQIICLEKLDNTLDHLMDSDEELSNDMWRSCLFQIIMNLVIYQKMFDFTHNDLHTNNVMYKKTDKQFIIYKLNGVHYKVPTFGRLFKIIDFGRAIYKFRDTIICSDSYSAKGDAASQYNCEPFFNKNKPRLEPNKSFDLCRLACSLFDFFVDDIDELGDIKCPITHIVNEWVTDDNGRNILYKKNGEERYPEFKLYKMIARTVHKHIPEEQVKNSIFNKFKTSTKKMNKSAKSKIINIDKLPSYINIPQETTEKKALS